MPLLVLGNSGIPMFWLFLKWPCSALSGDSAVAQVFRFSCRQISRLYVALELQTCPPRACWAPTHARASHRRFQQHVRDDWNRETAPADPLSSWPSGRTFLSGSRRETGGDVRSGDAGISREAWEGRVFSSPRKVSEDRGCLGSQPASRVLLGTVQEPLLSPVGLSTGRVLFSSTELGWM